MHVVCRWIVLSEAMDVMHCLQMTHDDFDGTIPGTELDGGMATQ